MADFKDLEKAKGVYKTLCQVLDKDGWKYKRDDENLRVECSARGEDLPMDLDIRVDAERMLAMVLSHLPFVIQEDKRLEIAVAVSAINNSIVHGFFDYNVRNGQLVFRMSNSFIDSNLGEEALHYLIYCTCQTVDEYNDKLLMLAKGMVSVKQFMEAVNA